MRVLIFEHALKVSGHRLGYAAQVATALSDHDVVVALPEVLRGEPVLEEYFHHEQRHHYPAPNPESFWQYARQSLEWLGRLIKQLQPDHVLIPTADGVATLAGFKYLLGLSKLGRVPIDICLMTGRRPASNLSRWEQWKIGLKWWVLQRGPWAHILLMDPQTWSEIPRQDRILLAPDPVPPSLGLSQAEARKALQLPTEGRLIVSAGNQDRRKGVDRLLAGFCKSGLPATDRLLLVGRFSEAVREQLATLVHEPAYPQIICRDQYLGETEFSQALLAADLVATPYRDTLRPSGVVSRSIAWGRPILAPDAGWLSWALREIKAGYVLDVTDADTIGRSMVTALETVAYFTPGAKAQRFADFNSQANYQTLWKNLIEAPERLPPSPDFLQHA